MLFMLLVHSCDRTLRCERHYLKNGFIGKVVIYFNEESGQQHINNDGCIVFDISEKGEYFSSLPFKEGTRNPRETFRFFEVISKDSLKEIFEYEKNEYLLDTVRNREKKYVFGIGGGLTNFKYVYEYYVDYGKNHILYPY
jgi:hypothetical protein